MSFNTLYKGKRPFKFIGERSFGAQILITLPYFLKLHKNTIKGNLNSALLILLKP